MTPRRAPQLPPNKPRQLPRQQPHQQPSQCRTNRGFTLLELLVAIGIMALLAGLSWRGLDGMARAQTISRERADQIATLQTALAQWQSDLDHLQETQAVSAIDYDGRVLRITRSDAPSAGQADLRVVGYTRRASEAGLRWLRWQSGPVRTRAELQTAWNAAQQWAQSPSEAARAGEVALAQIDDLQIFYFRNDAWSNPLSSAGDSPPAGPPSSLPAGSPASAPPKAAGSVAITPPPDGVRLVLKLSQGQPLAGTLTRDWARPIAGGGKS